MLALKHIDPTPPLEVVKKVYDMLVAGQWKTLEFAANVAYLISWSLQFLSDQKGNNPIFGEDNEIEEEFCYYCIKVHQWATDGAEDIAGSAIGAWLVKMMLAALLNRLMQELVARQVPEWIIEALEELREQLANL